uniref:FAD-dependent oxidoreductase n=1 Tax=Paractinoplanes polyasparticus TaxID=2856853 RepID=UPI001C8504D5|nr:squalene monooxygenase [Actinoplanes polyasparticus]
MSGSGRHAVVLGASIAGLLAARVLSDHFDKVTVVERDQLPDDAESRKGVPQDRHGHALLPRGVQILDELFPTLSDKMAADGVPRPQHGTEIWRQFGVTVLNRGGSEKIPGLQPSRPYLDSKIRDRIRRLPNVDMVDDCPVLGLTVAASEDRINGVKIAPRDEDEQALTADLVVDATGRGGRTPVWLRELGYPTPPETESAIDLAYMSRSMRLRPGALDGRRLVLILPGPGQPRILGLFEHEDNRHMVTLGGYADDHPPADLKDFQAFAASIAPGFVTKALSEAEWLDEPRRHHFPAGRRRHYEKLHRFPEGLLVIGDGMCSFNPQYGQGMTVAALEALALRDALTAGPQDLSRRYFTAAAKVIDPVWQMVGSADRAQLGQPQPLAERVIGAYMSRLHAASQKDESLARDFDAVSGLLQPPSSLFKPAVMWRVLAGNLTR